MDPKINLIQLFCLFGAFRPIRQFFTHKEAITGEGLQMTYTPQSRLLSALYRRRATNDLYSAITTSERSLSCYTYFDTQHPLILVISEDSWFTYLLPSNWQWSCLCLFITTCVCHVWDLNTQHSVCEPNALTDCGWLSNGILIESSVNLLH